MSVRVEAHKCCDSGADGLDRLRAGRDLFGVDLASASPPLLGLLRGSRDDHYACAEYGPVLPSHGYCGTS